MPVKCFCAGDLGYDITAFGMAAEIEPRSILCLGITACEANGTRGHDPKIWKTVILGQQF